VSRLNQVEILLQHPDGKPFGRRLVRFAKRALATLGLRGCELSICLATDRYVRSLNRRWRRRNAPTDVLSFPAGPSPIRSSGGNLLGDVVVSLDTARARAGRGKEGLERELERYLAHGLLHLLGYDHHRRAGAVEMASLELRLLGGKGMVPALPKIPRKGRARVGNGG
jgi:probable rRNA maturation factor